MTAAMIASTLERLQWDARAASMLKEAATTIENAMLLNRQADLAPGGHEAQAFITESLEHLVRRQSITVSERARSRAAQLGWQVATYEIAPVAKTSDDAVVFITGNSYMPPLRAFGISEEVWQIPGDAEDYWTVYAEAVERRLDELHVHMASPEYDNALYVVDLDRFEPEEGEDETTWIGRA